jgi:hypothetical protein
MFPDGLKKNERLASNVITPTTKSEDHDVPISPTEIVKQGLMDQADWDKVGLHCSGPHTTITVVFEVVDVCCRSRNLLSRSSSFARNKQPSVVCCLWTPNMSLERDLMGRFI